MSKRINETIKDFKYKGFRGVIRKLGYEYDEETLKLPYMRNNYWLCGYVEIPKEHKYYGTDYDDLQHLAVHGGLTYSNEASEGCWFIGFDCGHYGDDINIQNIDYVEREIKELVEQLI